MWAAFGQIENIPPLAFAMPAMFAKSSTIYNPIIYLMLRPNFRRVMCRDLGTFCHSCVKGCLCSERPSKCRSKPTIRVRLCTIHRQTNQFPPSNSSTQPPTAALEGHSCEKCEDAFECFRHYPQMCGVVNPIAEIHESNNHEDPAPQKQQKTQSVSSRKSLLASMCAKRTSDTENFHINLEMVPGHAKVAWPWGSSLYFCLQTQSGLILRVEFFQVGSNYMQSFSNQMTCFVLTLCPLLLLLGQKSFCQLIRGTCVYSSYSDLSSICVKFSVFKFWLLPYMTPELVSRCYKNSTFCLKPHMMQ